MINRKDFIEEIDKQAWAEMQAPLKIKWHNPITLLEVIVVISGAISYFLIFVN